MNRIWNEVRWRVAQMGHQFAARDCVTSAGALTYTTLFAVVPFMTVTYTVLSLRAEFAEVGYRVQTFVFQNFLPEASAVVAEQLLEFSERAQDLSAIGFVFLFVTAFMMLVTLEKALNEIWNVTEQRRGLQRLLVYWAVLSLGPPLIVAASIASIYLVSLPLLTDLDAFGVGAFLLPYLPVLFSIVAFTMVYYAVPNCPVRFLHALLGGLLIAFLFEWAKAGFAWLMGRLSFEPIYGSFAAVPLFLIWLHLVWVMILLGAVFVRTLALVRTDEPGSREPPLVKTLRILRLLYDAHQEGRPVTEADLQETVTLDRLEKQQIFDVLGEFRLLNHTDDEQWVLGRSLKTLTLWDLYQRLPEGLEDSRLDRVADVGDMGAIVEPLKNMARFGSNEMSVSLDTLFGSGR